jgi:hypothetical protein
VAPSFLAHFPTCSVKSNFLEILDYNARILIFSADSVTVHMYSMDYTSSTFSLLFHIS